MRVILVGTPAQRIRLRAHAVETNLTIVGEAASAVTARRSGPAADALLSAVSGDGGDEEGYQEELTSREIDVLELLAQGLPNKAIAERLGISDQTVKFHVSALTGKLYASNRTEVVRVAIQRGLVVL